MIHAERREDHLLHDLLKRLAGDDLDLAEQKRFAGDRFIRLRSAVLRRPAAVDVANKYVSSRDLQSLFDNVRQKLACTPDKWFALQILVSPGSLAHEHQVGVEITDAVHYLRASERREFTSCAVRTDLPADR